MISTWTKALGGAALSAALVLLPAVGSTVPIQIGGFDLVTNYTASTGVISFGTSAPGEIDSADDPRVVSAIGGQAFFEVQLDLSGGYDPATGKSRDASFVGTAGPDLILTDSGGGTLLTFEINRIDVGAFSGFLDQVTLGEASEASALSELILTGGSLATSIGTPGVTEARLSVELFDPSVNVKGKGLWAGDFSNSNTQWNLLIITAPEPGTALLVATSLLGLAALRRRGGR